MFRRSKKSERSPPDFHLETLETRILFSADSVLSLPDIMPERLPELVVFQTAQNDESVTNTQAQISPVVAKELVILDSGLPNLDTVVKDLTDAEHGHIQIVVLDAQTDGLQQISDILAEQQGLTAVHVLSIESNGALELGGQRFQTLDLLSRTEEVAEWRGAFALDAKILLYGCDLAADGTGQQFVNTIARLTGADVSASDDIIGSADAGDDWQLEYLHDALDNQVALTAKPQNDFSEEAAIVPGRVLHDYERAEDTQSTNRLQTSGVYEVVFVDPDTANYQQLVDDLINQADSERLFDVYLLDNSLDGIEQISEILANYESLDAVHIVSHGTDGSIDLGATRLDSAALGEHSDAIGSWADAFDINGDLLIYGCDLAASENGQGFVDELARLTSTDVAASVDFTGHTLLGGDWDLEYLQGDIENQVAFSAQLQDDWVGVLADITTGLLSHHTFDDQVGDVVSDSSGNDYDGTVVNGAFVSTNVSTNQIGDGKLRLDGTDDYVDLSTHVSNFDNLSQGTISAWFYANLTCGWS